MHTDLSDSDFGIKGLIKPRTIKVSTILDRTGVTEIGLKSLTLGAVFGTGVTTACFHALGTSPLLILKLISLDNTCDSSVAHSRYNQKGRSSEPDAVFLTT